MDRRPLDQVGEDLISDYVDAASGRGLPVQAPHQAHGQTATNVLRTRACAFGVCAIAASADIAGSGALLTMRLPVHTGLSQSEHTTQIVHHSMRPVGAC